MSKGIFQSRPSLLRTRVRTGIFGTASSMDDRHSPLKNTSRMRGNDVGARHGTGTQRPAVSE
jgi:hypothetical protein